MLRRLISVFLVLYLSVTAVFAQDDSWYLNKPISKIEFEGLKNVKKSDLTGIISTYIDQPFTEELCQEIYDRLYAMGLFDDIEPSVPKNPSSDGTVVLTLKITEQPVITNILFSGNQKIRNGELRELIKSKNSDVFEEGKIFIDERTIRNHYLEKGYGDCTVSHKIEEDEDGITVTFLINEGENTVITEIHTKGNSIVSERSLKSKLSLKEVGLFKEGAFISSSLEQDKKTIINYYKEKGYVDAEIINVDIQTNVNKDKKRKELIITFNIMEGSKYTFSGLTLSGNEVFSTEELLNLTSLKAGQDYNEIKFQEGLSNISGKYYEFGYMSLGIIPQINKNTDLKEIGYHLTIIENDRSHIENIIIRGNSRTKDYIIRREIPIQEGDVFARDKIMNGLRNLYNLQYFAEVVPDIQGGSEENLLNIIFNVEEQSTRNLNFGMTFSGVTDSEELPISLYAKVEDSNLFGEGKSVSAGITLSTTEKSIDFSYGQNWIGNQPIALNTSISLSSASPYSQLNMFLPNCQLDQYYYYMNYKSWALSLNTALGRRWNPNFAILTLSGGITASINKYEYDEALYVPTDNGISLFANRVGTTNSVWGSFSLDGRDINYDPSKGWFASEKISWYGLTPFEKEFFLRSDTILEGYLTLFDLPVTEKWNFKGVLAAQTNFIGLFPIADSPISESNRVYIDGMFRGRGWNKAYKSYNGKGLALWNSSLEFRMPISPNLVGFDFFYDAVAVKPNINSMFTDLSVNDFYFSFGPGLRFLIPQLPLRFLFAFKYRIQDNKIQWDDIPFEFVLSFNLVNK